MIKRFPPEYVLDQPVWVQYVEEESKASMNLGEHKTTLREVAMIVKNQEQSVLDASVEDQNTPLGFATEKLELDMI